MKKVYAIIAIFVGWEILDFIIHSLILGSAYAAQPQLWRPMGEMKMWLIYDSVDLFKMQDVIY